MYLEIAESLEYANRNQDIRVVVLTGKGKYYSSGNDLSIFVENSKGDPNTDHFDRFMKSFINLDKILIAAVNGPALGIAVTTLGHCDYVYASQNSTFKTPFTQLGQSPEGCSSLIFYELMGNKANEMLFGNKTFTSEMALRYNLVHDVFQTPSLLMDHVNSFAKYLASLPPNSLLESKKLRVNKERRALLLRTHERELICLRERATSEECIMAVMNFLNNKKNLGLKKDEWKCFLELCKSLGTEFPKGYTVDEAWPILFDEFYDVYTKK